MGNGPTRRSVTRRTLPRDPPVTEAEVVGHRDAHMCDLSGGRRRFSLNYVADEEELYFPSPARWS